MGQKSRTDESAFYEKHQGKGVLIASKGIGISEISSQNRRINRGRQTINELTAEDSRTSFIVFLAVGFYVTAG